MQKWPIPIFAMLILFLNSHLKKNTVTEVDNLKFDRKERKACHVLIW